MDKETQKRIFEPFFTTKKEGKGTGLGLSMVYGVMKNHGGYIAVYSEPGHGTTFKIYFPASGEAEDIRVLEPPAPHGRGELILVVDDEEPIREFAKDVLEGNGYRIILAENGVQAVRILEEYDGEISLVLLDMVMPKMGGHETFLRMKAGNPKIRVLLSTGYSQNGEAQAILDSGVKGFIQKPYKPNTLLSKVRSVIDEYG
jgi:CheY-like chemotaxis protein